MKRGIMGLPSLRQYQSRAVSDIKRLWSQGKRHILYVSPTGSGKTTVFAHIVAQETKPVLVLCPRREIVNQAADRIRLAGVDVGVMMGPKKPGDARVTVATNDTASIRELDDRYGLVVFDEAHHCQSARDRKLLKRFPSARVLGPTATPVRLDGRPLGAVFEEIVETITVSDLTKQGFLVPMTVYARQDRLAGNIGYSRKARDYSMRSTAKRMIPLVGDVYSEWSRLGSGKRTIVYCCSIPHAEAVCEEFSRNGVSSFVLTGKTPKKERERAIERLAAGELTAICNVDVLTEGLDVPPLEVIVLARPTLSLSLHLQMLGRALRPSPGTGKTKAICLDHADNCRKHGLATDERKWSLKRSLDPAGLRKGKGKDLTKTCPGCGASVSVTTVTCPNCRHVWLPTPEKGELKELDGSDRLIREIWG